MLIDSHYSKVLLYAPFLNFTGFGDWSPSNVMLSGRNGATISLIGGHYGAAFDGATSSRLIAGQLPAAIGVGKFTIQFWAWPVNGGMGDQWSRWLQIGTNSDANGGIAIANTNVSPSGIIAQGRSGGAWVDLIYPPSNGLPNNAWAHVALQNTGTQYQLFLNGVLNRSKTMTALNTSLTNFYVGSNSIGGERFNGCIRELIIANDALYSGDFVPENSYLSAALLGSKYLHQQSWPAALATIGNTSTVYGNGPVDAVTVYDHATRVLVASAVPDSSGAWSLQIPPGTYDVIYHAAGCQSLCHGPYTISV